MPAGVRSFSGRETRPVQWLIGLGNPGRAYEGTRHNMGFLVVEEIASRQEAAWRRSWRFPVRTCKIRLDSGQEAGLVESRSFMNRSGDAVAPFLRKKGVDAQDAVLIYDDVDLPLGRVRIRTGGGAGGHRGVRSVLDRMGTPEVARIRVGVGRARGDREMVEHVLSRFGPDERAAADTAVARAADAAWCLLNEGVETAMNRYNRTRQEQREAT